MRCHYPRPGLAFTYAALLRRLGPAALAGALSWALALWFGWACAAGLASMHDSTGRDPGEAASSWPQAHEPAIWGLPLWG